MLSVIIPIGGEDEKGRKRRNLDEMITCIEDQNYADYELIIVEETYGSKLYNDVSSDKYISVNNKGGYRNISWTRNVGSKISEGDILLHLDADLLFDKSFFEKVLKYDKKAFVAWNNCLRLTEEGLNDWRLGGFENIKDFNIDHREGQPIKPIIDYTAGFANCFERDFYFNEFGGFNENFFGWGGDDNDAALRYSTILGKYHIMPNSPIYHLPHGGRKTRQGNFEEWTRTQKDPLGITKLLLETKIGDLNGPKVV